MTAADPREALSRLDFEALASLRAELSQRMDSILSEIAPVARELASLGPAPEQGRSLPKRKREGPTPWRKAHRQRGWRQKRA